MTLTDTLTCTMPPAVTGSEAIVSCVTDATTNWAEIWVAVGTIFGALATTAAVIVALWQSMKATDASKRAEQLSQKQFDESTQLPALHAYVRAWRELSTPTVGSAVSPYDRLTAATLASTTWRDVNRKQLDNIRDIEVLQREITRCLRHMEPAYLEISNEVWKESGILRATHALTNIAADWQKGTTEERLQEGANANAVASKLRYQYDEFVDSVNDRLEHHRQQAANGNL